MLCARLKPISYSSREKQECDTPEERMAEPGSLGSHGGHPHLTAPNPQHRLLRAGLWPSMVSPEAGKKWCGCWLQGYKGREGLASLALDRQTDSDPAASNLGALLKNLETHNNIYPIVPAWGDDTHFLTEVLQPFCTSLPNTKSSSLGTRALNQNEREWESIAQSRLYLLFNTSPSCRCQHRERYITFFPISLTVPNFLQQIKVFSWRVRNLSVVLF